MMRRVRYVLPIVLLLVPVLRADAAPIFYDFTVTFNSGDLSGQSFDGSFSVDGDDCLQGVCDGFFAPLGSNISNALLLLSFDITIAGESFTISDDDDYPNYPLVVFNQGNVTGMTFLIQDVVNLVISLIEGNQAIFYLDQRVASEGTIGDFSQRDVPEPMTLSLLGVGLAGAAIRSRRRKSA